MINRSVKELSQPNDRDGISSVQQKANKPKSLYSSKKKTKQNKKQKQNKTVLELLKRRWAVSGRIHSTICLRMQTGNAKKKLGPLEAQVLEPTSVTLFCLNSEMIFAQQAFACR